MNGVFVFGAATAKFCYDYEKLFCFVSTLSLLFLTFQPQSNFQHQTWFTYHIFLWFCALRRKRRSSTAGRETFTLAAKYREKLWLIIFRVVTKILPRLNFHSNFQHPSKNFTCWLLTSLRTTSFHFRKFLQKLLCIREAVHIHLLCTKACLKEGMLTGFVPIRALSWREYLWKQTMMECY